MIVNLSLSLVMLLGSAALFEADKPMTNFCGLMLTSVAIVVAGYSFLAHRSAMPDEE